MIEKYFYAGEKEGIAGLFSAYGSFGLIDANCVMEHLEQENKEIYTINNGKVKVVASFTKYENGTIVRQDTLENLTEETVFLNRYFSRFYLDGNRYQVYTQVNGWQHENSGAWQELVTQVVAQSCGMRSCDGATPMMALQNKHTGKTTVFHLLPNCQWKIKAAKRIRWGQKEAVVVETGIEDSGLCMEIAIGEKISFPTVIFFEAENINDLDAYKLHETYNRLYPRKKMPILYDTWLYCFDNLNVEGILKQVDAAKELGIEIFFVDAGWFGEGEGVWADQVGDWEENLTGGTYGRLIEISNCVRSQGMTFGLWFEPERAGKLSKAAKAHPEYYIDGKFLDFSKAEAREYMFDVICKAIDKYKLGFLKFDFNDTLAYDLTGSSFYRYLEGNRLFVEKLREKYPDLYITNCASGGYRMDLYQATFYDSFWFTDNQGPYEGLTIIKNTLKRIPTSLIERWNVLTYKDGFAFAESKEPVGYMLSCNNAAGDYLITVAPSYTQGFSIGGPLGYSCDIASFPDIEKGKIKNLIADYKRDREFYINASARLLVDSDDVIVIEYADEKFERIEIQFFTKLIYMDSLTVYPAVNEDVVYDFGNKQISGKEIKERGISFENLKDNSCQQIKLIKKKEDNND